ncbi:MAG: glycosyltransferase family 4 protein [Candidatus Marinimicrobia bacterium]|nr:glycosyltransferase family 4 protein [Candidatus Neomarinimicrobiota bacterium]MCF7828557.1 glycosyltransferase family 4 protein [Candidatus Neomarinimicrobiota bacterium]MCF7880298.1 glycosyltransferase family 4 protein [Candidatus Neomarinimicrobiota bacterium]
MEIAILTHAFPPMRGGFSRYTFEIFRHWVAQGIDAEVWTSVDFNDSPILNEAKLYSRVHYIQRNRDDTLGAFQVFRKFWQKVKEDRPQYVFFPTWVPYAFFTPMIPFPAHKVIIATHAAEILGLYPKSTFKAHPVVKYLGRRALRRADYVFTISNYTENLLVDLNVNQGAISKFPNGVDIKKFRQIAVNKRELLRRYSLRHVGEEPVLLTVAQLNPRKGIDTAIRIVADLKNEGMPVQYVIIGTGEYEQELHQLVAHHNIESRVHILTNVDDADLVKFYNICDLFILLSRHEGERNIEGFGIVFLEANACGKPVIAGKSGGIPDAVVHGKSGYLVDPGDISEIKFRIRYLINNPEVADEMGQYGEERAETKFTWKKITEDMACTLGLG